ncbi:MAG TPA: 4-hydroxy-tetrahydrodipicolinate synthase [Clostridiales bacterium]|nr:MAG: 4-hydroxy-tetrahydrodipicolinate synthase [Clostridiales bacterium GWD2_32_59]HAN10350.1 4-hydroxy-tetrahydrodipicolinate synthase [Clostridiales bacterium]
MSLFTGAGVAIVTPFDENDDINFGVLEELIEFQIENKIDAIIACGTTGESVTMSEKEHISVVKFTVDKVSGRIPVIAGTGSNNTKHAIELSRESEKVGANGLLVVTPYYNKTSQKGLIEHYTAIANSVSIPIIMYNVPSRTSLNMLPKTIYELSKVNNIIGLKECCGNMGQIAEIIDLCGENFDVYSGNDDEILPILSLGGKGVISTIANIIPNEIHDIVESYMDGNIKKSRELQLKYLKLIKAIFLEVNPIPIKAALNMIGYNVGKGRLPLTTMTEENLKLLQAEVTKI